MVARSRRRCRASKGDGPPWRRIGKWVLLGVLGWIVLSMVAFAVSAQIQKGKLADGVTKTLAGNPFMLASPQTVLVLGTDVRSGAFAGPDEAESQNCIEAVVSGRPKDGSCKNPPFRSDTIMLIRAGRGTFRKLSIPRDTLAEVPGQGPQKINSAYASGGAKLAIRTVEGLLGIDVDQVAIIDFDGFRQFIDTIGGTRPRLESSSARPARSPPSTTALGPAGRGDALDPNSAAAARTLHIIALVMPHTPLTSKHYSTERLGDGCQLEARADRRSTVAGCGDPAGLAGVVTAATGAPSTLADPRRRPVPRRADRVRVRSRPARARRVVATTVRPPLRRSRRGGHSRACRPAVRRSTARRRSPADASRVQQSLRARAGAARRSACWGGRAAAAPARRQRHRETARPPAGPGAAGR